MSGHVDREKTSHYHNRFSLLAPTLNFRAVKKGRVT